MYVDTEVLGFTVSREWGNILLLYRDNGKEHGNDYMITLRVSQE